jgi:hypothetical protein
VKRKPPAPQELRNGQCVPDKSNGLAGGTLVFDALVFEFMGLVMLALCIVVLAVPSQRRPSRRVSDT